MKRFEYIEVVLIRNAIELRKNKSDSEYTKKLNLLLNKLYDPIVELKKIERSLIRSCVRDLVIYPKGEIMQKTEYELLLVRDEIEQECQVIDVALTILNKVKRREEPKKVLFKETFEKLDKIRNSNKVYYSKSSNGEIYKVGIVTDTNEGVILELSRNIDLSNFTIGNLSGESFMQSTSPQELVNYLKEYGKENRLTETHYQFIKIFESNS